MFKDVPMKIVVPIIVVTWVLSLISSLAIVSVAPSLFGIKVGIDEGAVTSDKIATNAIITVKMADGNVTSAKILDGTITTVDLATGAVYEVNVANGAVTRDKIADGAVTEGKIASDAIATIMLKDGSVTTDKILNGTVAAVDLANNSVISAKIEDGAVTASKLAPNAIPYAYISLGVIFGSPFGSDHVETTATKFEDMPSVAVSFVLDRSSTLLIMFSAELRVNETGAPLLVSALVNGNRAYPNDRAFVVIIGQESDLGVQLLYGDTDRKAYSFIFNYPNATPGNYVVKMQWKTTSGARADAYARSLGVIALPA